MTRARDINPVKRRREELMWNLTDLARAIDRSGGMISMIEGGFVPKRATQVAIATALRSTPEDLWPGEYA